MSRSKKSLFILSSFVLGSFLCSFLVVKELERQDREAYAVRYHEYQRVALAHDKAQYARQKNIGRSIATYSKDAQPVVIINQKIDIRIYQITKITKIVKNDRALLAELSKKERQIRRLLKVNRGQKKEIAQLKRDLADVQRQMQDSQASLEKQVTELEAEKENLKKLLAEAEAQNVEIVSRRDELQEKLDEAQLMIEETKKEAEELSVKVTELNAKIEEQEAMIAELKKANCEKQDKISKLEEEVAGHIADKEEIMTKIEELEEELASLEEDEDADEEDEDSDSDSDTTPRRVASNDNNALVVQQMMAAFSQQMQMQQFQMQQFQMQAQMFTQINQQPVGMDQFTMMTMMNNMMMSNMMGKMATGGWGMPGGMASYDHLLHSPTYSLMDPVYSPVFYDQGIPSGIGLGRSPAVSPVQRQGNIFTKVPQSF